jgi:hypothetical protein
MIASKHADVQPRRKEDENSWHAMAGVAELLREKADERYSPIE